MRNAPYLLSLLLLGLLSSCSTGDKQVQRAVRAFEISEVKLLEGPYLRATGLNEVLLLNYEPDRFLAKFRMEAGLEPRAEHYHGWEDNTIAGHSLGHYLTAICLMYQTTGNPEYKDRALYITDELELCQEADGDGYIGAFPEGKRILEEEVAKGNIRARGFNLNGIWVPYYTQHKVMDGLFHVYRTFGYQKALDLNVRFADWLYGVLKDLSHAQVQDMLNCEHGGINESLAELYGITGNARFLEMSKLFQHEKIINPIISGEDILAGKHSNTQIPKFIGLARRYELTGDERDKTGALNFWDMMVHHHSYVTGGNGNHEYLGKPDQLNHRLSHNTTESCNVYNMLKLSEHLFSWSADPEVMDFYERALLNHIRSSQHPHSGHVIYNLSIDMGGFKVYQDPYSFTCCVGSGMESHAKYSRNIYYHNDRDLYAVQYIASELTWKDKGVSVRQQTRYPEEEDIVFTMDMDKPVRFGFSLRYPGWLESEMEVWVNDEKQQVDQEAGSFVRIHRLWKSGDQVEVRLPFSLRLESMPDNPNRIAVFNGPVVLAGDLGPVPDPDSHDPLYVPVLISKDKQPSHWLTPLEDKTNAFRTSEISYPRDVELHPFYRTHDRHYTIFWDRYTEQEWEKQQEEYAREAELKKELKRRTIDLFRLGEMQPERDHHFMSKDSWVEEYRSHKARTADRGGWFSFRMKVEGPDPVALSVEYWGGYTGSKTFDILVDGEVIATENIADKAPGRFIDISYDIPVELIQGKDELEVKFVPHEGHRAGPVFTVRTIRVL